MNQQGRPMAIGAGITDAVDWEDLGRRIRTAAEEAVELGVLPSVVRDKPSRVLPAQVLEPDEQ